MEKKKEQTPEEKKEGTIMLIMLIISGVVTYFLYKWIIVGLIVPLFGLTTGWKIGIVIFEYFVVFGALTQAYNKSTFFDTHKYGIKPQEDSTSKIAKLKELKDKGAISKQEFEKKKKELLEKI